MARTMSGMIMGAKSSMSVTGEARRCSTPRARSVPSAVAITVDTAATMSELPAARRMSGRRASSRYQSKVKPVHTVGRPARLRLRIMSIAIGA